MNETYDVIVVGLGGMGSAAACHLARRGKRVLGLERFTVGHGRGSSHGGPRIIRLAYVEDPAYVPFLEETFTGYFTDHHAYLLSRVDALSADSAEVDTKIEAHA